jgi:hypothetical protein
MSDEVDCNVLGHRSIILPHSDGTSGLSQLIPGRSLEVDRLRRRVRRGMLQAYDCTSLRYDDALLPAELRGPLCPVLRPVEMLRPGQVLPSHHPVLQPSEMDGDIEVRSSQLHVVRRGSPEMRWLL